MSYHHTDQSRETEETALPDVEIFHIARAVPYDECPACDPEAPNFETHTGEHVGYYYALGFPGCLWDSEPIGPFKTEAVALEAARESAGF